MNDLKLRALDEDPDIRRTPISANLTIPFLATMTALLTAWMFASAYFIATLWAERQWVEKRFDDMRARVEKLEGR